MPPDFGVLSSILDHSRTAILLSASAKSDDTNGRNAARIINGVELHSPAIAGQQTEADCAGSSTPSKGGSIKVP